MAISKQQLIEALNEDLAREYQAVIQYRTYASAVRGPYRRELRAFFETEIADELTLADKVVSLGGTPATQNAPVRFTDDARQMLQNALEDEEATIKRYVERRSQAEELKEYGLAVDMDDLIADESKHRDELRLMLDRWS